MGKPVAVTDQEFEELVLNSKTPVLVDFWADWCGPCKMIAPIVEDLAEEYNGQVSFVKVDVDANPITAGKFGIRSIPTLLVIKDGKPVDMVVGAVPKEVLKQRLDTAIA
jgi:thioredoxin 1